MFISPFVILATLLLRHPELAVPFRSLGEGGIQDLKT
jgi:hypothetical protein